MRVELLHIGGDIYVNGQKIAFAVDYNNPPVNPAAYKNIEWLMGWAKIGLISRGHDVPHFQIHDHKTFEAVPVKAAIIPQEGLTALDGDPVEDSEEVFVQDSGPLPGAL